MDNDAALLFIMTMSPIPKTMGQTIPGFYMPTMLNRLSDWLNSNADQTDSADKRAKKAITPATVAKEKLNPELLLLVKFSRVQNPIFSLPAESSSSAGFTSYYFHLFFDLL
jgi:hypothetical protein